MSKKQLLAAILKLPVDERFDLISEVQEHTPPDWIAPSESPEFIAEFNHALKSGVENIAAVVTEMGQTGVINGKALELYLTKNIDFKLDTDKNKAMELFLSFLRKG